MKFNLLGPKTDTQETMARKLREHSGAGIFLGLWIILMGLFAFLNPLLTGIAATLLFGWTLLFVAIFQVIYAIRTRKSRRFILTLSLGLLYGLAGLLLLANPLKSLLTLTLVLGISILLHGILQVILSFQLKPTSGWGWTLMSGILSIILGTIIWHRWPVNAQWLVGLLVGISLWANGLWVILAATNSRPISDKES